MSLTLEVGKKYVTRDCKGVGRVLTYTTNSSIPVCLKHPDRYDGRNMLERYSINGIYGHPSSQGPFDLVYECKEPVKRDVYFNAYYSNFEGIHLDTHTYYENRKDADEEANAGRVGCIKVTLEERYDD